MQFSISKCTANNHTNGNVAIFYDVQCESQFDVIVDDHPRPNAVIFKAATTLNPGIEH